MVAPLRRGSCRPQTCFSSSPAPSCGGCPASAGTPWAHGDAALLARGCRDPLRGEKIQQRRSCGRWPWCGCGELLSPGRSCEWAAQFLARKAERGPEAPAALANTSLIANHDLKMHQLAARELAIAKKCSSCGDMNYTVSSSSENWFLKRSCPWSAAQPFVSGVLAATLPQSGCEPAGVQAPRWPRRFLSYSSDCSESRAAVSKEVLGLG